MRLLHHLWRQVRCQNSIRQCAHSRCRESGPTPHVHDVPVEPCLSQDALFAIRSIMSRLSSRLCRALEAYAVALSPNCFCVTDASSPLKRTFCWFADGLDLQPELLP